MSQLLLWRHIPSEDEMLQWFCIVYRKFSVTISNISWAYHYLAFQAALRKISANCGTKVIEDLDAMELVEPRLLDSFLIYSSRQESYVWTRTRMPHEIRASQPEVLQCDSENIPNNWTCMRVYIYISSFMYIILHLYL